VLHAKLEELLVEPGSIRDPRIVLASMLEQRARKLDGRVFDASARRQDLSA
jgi:inactivated superfamily I helicase